VLISTALGSVGGAVAYFAWKHFAGQALCWIALLSIRALTP
jgi:tetrahydromethanopterin S-methyltransferase subunit D